MVILKRVFQLYIFSAFLFLPGICFGQNITGEDLTDFLPEESENFTLEQVDPDEDAAFIKADYIHQPTDTKIPFYLAYGEASEILYDYNASGYSQESFTYSRDISELREKSDDAYSIAQELLGDLSTKLLAWELENGTLRDDYPMTGLFPIHLNSFSVTNFRVKTDVQTEASYRHSDLEQTVQFQLHRGELAHQEHELVKCEWTDQNAFEIAGETFYGNASESGMTIKTYTDGYFIDVTLRDRTDNPDVQHIEQQMEKFMESFNINRLSDWEAPVPKTPAVLLSEEQFADFLPDKTEHFSLQDIESKENAMLVKANYLYKPEEHMVTLNMAYRDDTNKLGGRTQSVGNFRLNVVPKCLGNEVETNDYNNHFSELYENIDESELANWEIEQASLEKVNPLARYFPATIGNFTVNSIRPDDEDLTVKAEYQQSDQEDPVNVLVTYGDDAARRYNQLQLSLFENEPTEMEVDNTSFDVLEMDDDIVAFKYDDHWLITVGYSDIDQENKEDLHQQLANFLNSFQPNQLANFEAPENYEMDFTGEKDGTKLCLGLDCFDEQISKCEPAQFGGRLQYRLGVMYKIEEPSGDNQCRLSFEYTRNPNSDLEEQPLYFLMNREDSFLESGRDIIEDCLEGNTELCEGPLLDIISEGD